MARGAEFRCFNCGAATIGAEVRGICGCGLAAGRGLFPFRCEPNPAPSPANPAAIVIVRATTGANTTGRKS